MVALCALALATMASVGTQPGPGWVAAPTALEMTLGLVLLLMLALLMVVACTPVLTQVPALTAPSVAWSPAMAVVLAGEPTATVRSQALPLSLVAPLAAPALVAPVAL